MTLGLRRGTPKVSLLYNGSAQTNRPSASLACFSHLLRVSKNPFSVWSRQCDKYEDLWQQCLPWLLALQPGTDCTSDKRAWEHRHVVRVHICKISNQNWLLGFASEYYYLMMNLDCFLCQLLFDSFMVYFCMVKLIYSEAATKYLKNLPILFDFT